ASRNQSKHYALLLLHIFASVHDVGSAMFVARIADILSFVKRRGELQSLALCGVVIDPELGVLLHHHVSDTLHRSHGLVLVEIDRGHAAIVPRLPFWRQSLHDRYGSFSDSRAKRKNALVAAYPLRQSRS